MVSFFEINLQYKKKVNETNCKIWYEFPGTSNIFFDQNWQGCCNHGSAATYTAKGWDCLQIPGARNTIGTGLLNNFCGGKLIAVTAAITSSITSATVCSKLKKTFRFVNLNCVWHETPSTGADNFFRQHYFRTKDVRKKDVWKPQTTNYFRRPLFCKKLFCQELIYH